MKKIALFALAALALMSCQREVVDPQESSVPTYTVTITARLAQTRTAYDDAGKFSWAAGDKINVLITNGTTQKQVAFTTAEAGPEVQFTGQVDEGFTVGAEAAYAIDFDAAKKAWVLPESVTVDPLTPLSSLPLFGAKDEGDLFQFKTATGVLKFTVENVPVETAAVSLETVDDEAPALCGELEAAPADGVVTMAALKNGGKKLVAAGAPAKPNTTKDYYFFVPAGTLPAENTVFSVVDGSDNVIESFTFQKAVEVAANRITNVAPVHFEAVIIRNRQTDSLALVAIYNAIDASTWKEDKKWDLTKPINEWASGIKLNTDGRVTQISFTALLASALWTLPEEIGNLTELTTLKLNKNVKGQLPESVFTLPKLEKFYFENGDLEGTLSEKLGQMTTLTELYVDGNAKLEGSISAAFGQLKNLVKINVSNTGISGTLPAELANCTALTDIVASNAKLSGELPDIWGSLTALKSLMLNGNQGLTGPLPASLGSLTKLTGIQLQNCSFTGNIPVEWGNLPSTCKTLNVSGNQLKGVVPSAVQAHANWTAWKPATNILPQQEGYGLTLE